MASLKEEQVKQVLIRSEEAVWRLDCIGERCERIRPRRGLPPWVVRAASILEPPSPTTTDSFRAMEQGYEALV
jgi:hypothetical protein